MASGRHSHRALTGLLLLLLALLPEAAYTQVALVVNRKNPVANLTLEQLRRLYLGTSKTFPGGIRVTLIEFPVLRVRFYRTLLGMTDDQLKRHWMAIVFAGEGTSPPKEIAGPDDLRRFVAEHAGALAFLPLVDVDGSVKVVAIGGVNPGDANYPLRAVAENELLRPLHGIEMPLLPSMDAPSSRKP
jgi:hypothetical protein